LDNTYDNLTIAGDWTSCGLNQGCVEAAVISGRLAAHAISSQPALSEIVGYDHP
jgi:predicted NAD/FAD-dependent oxidoreductase